jgi:hypothetical protein
MFHTCIPSAQVSDQSRNKFDRSGTNHYFDEPVSQRSNKFQQDNALLLEKIDFLSGRINELSKSPD